MDKGIELLSVLAFKNYQESEVHTFLAASHPLHLSRLDLGHNSDMTTEKHHLQLAR